MISQVPREAVRGFFEPVAQLTHDAGTALERAGVVFTDETDDVGEPGPTRFAVVALANDRQYLLVSHYAHPEAFFELRASIDEPDAKDAVAAFAQALGLLEGDMLWMVAPSDWPPGRT